MSGSQIADYFQVKRSSKTARSSKRNVDSDSSKLAVPPAKRPAHLRLAHLAETFTNDEAISPQSTTEHVPLESNAIRKTESTKELVGPKTRPVRSVKAKETKAVAACQKLDKFATATKDESPLIDAIDSKPPPTPNHKRTVIKLKKPPAYKRFAHLAELPPASSSSSSSPQLTGELAQVLETAQTSKLSTETELTQTESSVSPDLVLPQHMRALLELFRSCDTVVSMIHNRKELCSFDKLKPAVQEIVRRNFEETHVGQFLTVYPMVYSLRYEKQMDKFTRRPTGNYVLVLCPNLRTDGTQIGYDSPSKGFLPFSGTRLIQRRNRFHQILVGIVLRAHREFLIHTLGIDSNLLPDDSSLRRWHPQFPLETGVSQIKPSPLPIRPSDLEEKITTAKDAVRAFQARALFREAETCQRLASNQMPSIPSPQKSAISSPRKFTIMTGSDPEFRPRALFTSDTVNTAPLTSANTSLKGVSAALLNKVRAREQERRLLAELTHSNIPQARRAIYSRLPVLIPHVWTILRASNGRPLPMVNVASRVADAYPSGITADSVREHLDVLIELIPSWIEKLAWVTPHLRLKSPDQPIKDVIDQVKSIVAKQGFIM